MRLSCRRLAAMALMVPAAVAQAAAKAPAAASPGQPVPGRPAVTKDAAPSRADLLDGLHARLYLAKDGPQAKVIARTIRELWLKAGTDTAVLLLTQAGKALKAGQGETALRILDLVVRRWPDYAEGWHRRAVTRYMLGDARGALRDLDKVLSLEPRHFEALFTKAAILQELKRPAAAMEAYRAALLIYPGMTPAREALKALELKLDQTI